MKAKTCGPHSIGHCHLLRLTQSVFFDLSVDIWARLIQLHAVRFLPKQPLNRQLRAIQGLRSGHLRGNLGLAVDNCQDLLWNWDAKTKKKGSTGEISERLDTSSQSIPAPRLQIDRPTQYAPEDLNVQIRCYERHVTTRDVPD
jgi:hypothetical protein